MNEIIEPSWPIAQKKYEILMLQELLKNEKISRIVEIGTWTGGTARLWAKMVSRYDDGIVYCCDLSFHYGTHQAYDPVADAVETYNNQLYNGTPEEKFIKELQGNSHDPAFIESVKNQVGINSIDFMFIDGDHSYQGIKADFNNFYSLVKKGSYIAFHDIIDSEYHRNYGVHVSPFWNEIKHQFEWWEFIDNNIYYGPTLGKTLCPSRCMGIGVIRVR